MPSEDQWREIVSKVAAEWVPVRKKFFLICSSTVAEVGRKRNRNRTSPACGELGGALLSAITAYQLWDCGTFVFSCPYLDASNCDLFFRQLFDEVVPKPEEGVRVLSYIELFNKTADEPIRFAKEVVQHVTGAASPYEAPFEESFAVMYLIPWFCGLSRIVIANAFGDEETARLIQTKIQEGTE